MREGIALFTETSIAGPLECQGFDVVADTFYRTFYRWPHSHRDGAELNFSTR